MLQFLYFNVLEFRGGRVSLFLWSHCRLESIGHTSQKVGLNSKAGIRRLSVVPSEGSGYLALVFIVLRNNCESWLFKKKQWSWLWQQMRAFLNLLASVGPGWVHFVQFAIKQNGVSPCSLMSTASVPIKHNTCDNSICQWKLFPLTGIWAIRPRTLIILFIALRDGPTC